jgi:ABC-type sugar transport system permease subunit
MTTLTSRPLTARLRGRQDRNLWFWVFVGPFFVGLLVFVYIPILWSVYLSFFDARNTVTPTHFVGLANYIYLLTDRAFLSSMGTFTVFAIFIVPVTFAGSLGLALLVNKARVAQAFFRAAFFLPTACSYVIAAMIWRLSFFSGAGLLCAIADPGPALDLRGVPGTAGTGGQGCPGDRPVGPGGGDGPVDLGLPTRGRTVLPG